jgi:hypothetical protein
VEIHIYFPDGLPYNYCSHMVARENISKLPTLALRRRLEGLAKRIPTHSEFLRGTLLERYLTCGNPNCKCAAGKRHGPIWYLSVTLDAKHRSGLTVPEEKVAQVRQWIANYQHIKDCLEKISDINRELLRREKPVRRPKSKKLKPSA